MLMHHEQVGRLLEEIIYHPFNLNFGWSEELNTVKQPTARTLDLHQVVMPRSGLVQFLDKILEPWTGLLVHQGSGSNFGSGPNRGITTTKIRTPAYQIFKFR